MRNKDVHQKLDIFTDSSKGGYNYEYDKLNNRTITRLQEIRDELIPKEKSK